MHHLSRQVLSSGIMDRYTSIFTASNKNFAVLRIGEFSNRFVELNEFISYTSFLNVKNTHSA